MCTIHGPRCWSFEVDAFVVVTTAVARALEFVFRGLPVGSATKMRAARIDHKQPIRATIHPDAIFLLPLGIDAESVVLRVADLERSRRFKQRARQEKSEECQEPCSEKRSNHGPSKTPSLLIDFVVLGANCSHPTRFRSFGSSDRRSSYVANGITRPRDGSSHVDWNSL